MRLERARLALSLSLCVTHINSTCNRQPGREIRRRIRLRLMPVTEDNDDVRHPSSNRTFSPWVQSLDSNELSGEEEEDLLLLMYVQWELRYSGAQYYSKNKEERDTAPSHSADRHVDRYVSASI